MNNIELGRTFKTPLKIDLTPHLFSFADLKSYANCSDKKIQNDLVRLSECFRDGGLVKIIQIPPKNGEIKYGIGFEAQSCALWTGDLGWRKMGKLLELIFKEKEAKDKKKIIKEIKDSIEENREVFLQIKK